MKKIMRSPPGARGKTCHLINLEYDIFVRGLFANLFHYDKETVREARLEKRKRKLRIKLIMDR